MGSIAELLRDGTAAFGPHDVRSMSMALDDVCKALNIDGDTKAREIIAIRIIELARRGERSPTKLRDRLLAEANGLRPIMRLREQMLRDEAEMRAFYQRLGIRPETTELAIQALRDRPVQEQKKPPASKHRPARASAKASGRSLDP